MKAVSFKVTHINSDGSREVEALIVSSTTPAELPTTGGGIEGLAATDTFAPMSIIYVVADVATKVYIANESGVFIAQ